MKPEDKYLMFVQWSEEDQNYVGYCPDLFPGGGVCDALTSVEAFQKLHEIVEETVRIAQSKRLELPPARTRPMREVEALVT